MKEHMKINLLRWALMADVLVNNHYSHERRWQRVEVIKRLIIRESQVEKQALANALPLWADTLIAILNASNFETGTYSTIDHTEARNALRLFSDTCHYIANKYYDIWFDWAKEAYDAGTGECLKPPLRNNPFVSTNDKSDDDDNDPFAAAMGEIEF